MSITAAARTCGHLGHCNVPASQGGDHAAAFTQVPTDPCCACNERGLVCRRCCLRPSWIRLWRQRRLRTGSWLTAVEWGWRRFGHTRQPEASPSARDHRSRPPTRRLLLWIWLPWQRQLRIGWRYGPRSPPLTFGAKLDLAVKNRSTPNALATPMGPCRNSSAIFPAACVGCWAYQYAFPEP
jgi:hypothetical protein